MNPITKKSPKRGRPKTPVSVKIDRDALSKIDGERLSKARTQHLGISQEELGRRAGIPQSLISQYEQGDRAISRDDLRRLGRAGVSPEFVLGLSGDRHNAPGQRSALHLHADLAAELMRDLEQKFPAASLHQKKRWRWVVSGKHAYAALLQRIEGDAAAQVEEVENYSAASVGLAFLKQCAPNFRKPLTEDEKAIAHGIAQLESIVQAQGLSKPAIHDTTLALLVPPQEFKAFTGNS